MSIVQFLNQTDRKITLEKMSFLSNIKKDKASEKIKLINVSEYIGTHMSAILMNIEKEKRKLVIDNPTAQAALKMFKENIWRENRAVGSMIVSSKNKNIPEYTIFYEHDAFSTNANLVYAGILTEEEKPDPDGFKALFTQTIFYIEKNSFDNATESAFLVGYRKRKE